jgi:hypothetical protein
MHLLHWRVQHILFVLLTYDRVCLNPLPLFFLLQMHFWRYNSIFEMINVKLGHVHPLPK